MLLFLLIFRDHTDLRKARTVLNILMDVTVKVRAVVSSGIWGSSWQWLMRKLSRQILAMLQMLVLADGGSSSHSSTC